jgi:voltage-gated potassium channel
MTSDPYLQLSSVKRRRLVGAAVLRGLLTATVLVVLYYVLPFETWNGDTALRLLAGLVIFVGITAWQIRSIAGSRYPGLKAAEVLGLLLPLYLLVFASTYYAMERASAAAFSQPLTRTDALYFTVTVFSAVGFGDIVPKSEVARVVLIVQMLGDLALLGAGTRICSEPYAVAGNGEQTQARMPTQVPDLAGPRIVTHYR